MGLLKLFGYFFVLFYTTAFLMVIYADSKVLGIVLTIAAIFGFIKYLIYDYKKTHNKRNEKVRRRFDFIDVMDGHEFESYLKEILVLNNHHVLLTPKSRDQGADLIVTRDDERIAIQAKRYSQPVGNKAVQEVLGAIHYYNCNYGIVITNASYTTSAIQLAERANVRLWTKKEIKQLIYAIRDK